MTMTLLRVPLVAGQRHTVPVAGDPITYGAKRIFLIGKACPLIPAKEGIIVRTSAQMATLPGCYAKLR